MNNVILYFFIWFQFFKGNILLLLIILIIYMKAIFNRSLNGGEIMLILQKNKADSRYVAWPGNDQEWN